MRSIDHLAAAGGLAASRAFDTVPAPLVDPFVGEGSWRRLRSPIPSRAGRHRRLHVAFAATSREQVDASRCGCGCRAREARRQPVPRRVRRVRPRPGRQQRQAVFHDRARTVVPRALSLVTDIDVLGRLDRRAARRIPARSLARTGAPLGQIAPLRPRASRGDGALGAFAREFGDEPLCAAPHLGTARTAAGAPGGVRRARLRRRRDDRARPELQQLAAASAGELRRGHPGARSGGRCRRGSGTR